MGMLGSVTRILRQDLVYSESALSAAFLARLYWYCSIRRKLRTVESGNAIPLTVQHNLKALRQRLNRMLLLIRPLSVLEQVPRDARILVIGPRNEWDLLLLARHGFPLRNQTGLDLISYSPRIELGDMHAMPFADGAFDVVLCGWTLSYSATPALACREMARVCKPGGVVGIGVQYFDGSQDDQRQATGGYLLQDERLAQRINSVAQILELFPGHGAVHFSHDAPLRRSLPRDPLPSNCAVIFSR